MSGLLQRLARQVVGPAPLMARARIAPRFASGTEAVPAGDVAEQVPPTAAPGLHLPPVPPSAPTYTTNPWEVAAHTSHRTTPSAGIMPHPAAPPNPTRAHDRMTASPSGMRADTAAPTASLTAHQRLPAHPPPLLPPSLIDVPSRTPHTPAGSDTDAREQQAGARSLPPPLFAARTGDAQAPLPANTAAGLHQHARPARARDAEAPDSAPNEVHVHIGRIEVTALQDAPAAKPRTRGRQPMSLDEYLARRQGERR